jgi:hypothetical protein
MTFSHPNSLNFSCPLTSICYCFTLSYYSNYRSQADQPFFLGSGRRGHLGAEYGVWQILQRGRRCVDGSSPQIGLRRHWAVYHYLTETHLYSSPYFFTRQTSTCFCKKNKKYILQLRVIGVTRTLRRTWVGGAGGWNGQKVQGIKDTSIHVTIYDLHWQVL